MLYSVMLTFIFKVRHFLVIHLLLKNCAGSGYPPADLEWLLLTQVYTTVIV